MKYLNDRSWFPQKSLRILAIMILLAACQPSKQYSLVETALSVTATAIPSATVSPSATPTQFVPTPTMEASPFDGILLPLLKPRQILTSDFSDEDFQDLIIFSSNVYGNGVFANVPLDVRWAEGNETHLFAFSPIGQRAGILIPPEFASNIYVPSNPADKLMLVEYGVEFDHPDVQGIELPAECYQPGPGEDRLIACGNFQFSPDGQYLGFFYGAPACWRGIIIQDTQTGRQVYHSTYPDGHYFSLFNDGHALIATGHCEGGGVAFHNLNTGEIKPLGGEGQQRWNVDKTAFAAETNSFDGIDNSIWGFNLETEQKFMKEPEERQIDDHPVWTPDRDYLLYQHRTFTRDDAGFTPTSFNQSRQIILVNAQNGTQKPILSDPGYDFHLGSCSTCDAWYGDWIQIRRVAFTPEPITGGESIYTSQSYTCRLDAQNCAPPVELFALNWKTGELQPWTDMIEKGLVPDPGVTPTPLAPSPDQQPVFEVPGQYKLYAGPGEYEYLVEWKWGGESGAKFLSGPDLTTTPIYKHPDGLYAYYVGIDGKTLWMVPKEGIALPWVMDGHNYFYIGSK